MISEIKTMHAFEKAGLGKAPFALVAVSNNGPSVSCTFCGTAITQVCVIQDSNGNRFIVGNVCVSMRGGLGLIKQVKNAMRPIRLAARHKQEAIKIKELGTLLDDPSIEARLKGRAHPAAWGQKKSLTLWDWATWMWVHAGNSGKLKTLRTIQKALA